MDFESEIGSGFVSIGSIQVDVQFLVLVMVVLGEVFVERILYRLCRSILCVFINDQGEIICIKHYDGKMSCLLEEFDLSHGGDEYSLVRDDEVVSTLLAADGSSSCGYVFEKSNNNL